MKTKNCHQRRVGESLLDDKLDRPSAPRAADPSDGTVEGFARVRSVLGEGHATQPKTMRWPRRREFETLHLAGQLRSSGNVTTFSPSTCYRALKAFRSRRDLAIGVARSTRGGRNKSVGSRGNAEPVGTCAIRAGRYAFEGSNRHGRSSGTRRQRSRVGRGAVRRATLPRCDDEALPQVDTDDALIHTTPPDRRHARSVAAIAQHRVPATARSGLNGACLT